MSALFVCDDVFFHIMIRMHDFLQQSLFEIAIYAWQMAGREPVKNNYMVPTIQTKKVIKYCEFIVYLI
jgi:hypothetical protein